MEQIKKLTGLCQNCKFNKDCSYMKNSTMPTIFCEEFEVDSSPTDHNKDEVLDTFNTNWESGVNSDLKGICSNCDYSVDCNYKDNSQNPILFCEQYK